MKKLCLLLMTFLLASAAIAQTEYDERVYLFRSTTYEGPEETEAELLEACESAIAESGIGGIDMQGPNAVAVRRGLHRPKTQQKTGLLKKDKNNKKQIGEALMCQDWDSFLLSGLSNFIPVFYQVSIDGMTFNAEGGGISTAGFGQLPGGGQVMAPATPPFFYPAERVLLVNFSATIVPSLPPNLAESLGVPVAENIGGTMAGNGLFDLADPDGVDDQFETEGFWVIRLLIPVEE